MSVLHPQEGRECKVCHHRWLAERYAWSPDAGPVKGSVMGAGANTGYGKQRANYERWKKCPKCGSNKVKTRPKKGFVPSAAEPAPVQVVASGRNCACGAVLSPGWNFCPMCATPVPS